MTEKKVKVCGCIAVPRLGWTDAWGSIVDAFTVRQIPLRRFTTCYWEQGISNVLEMLIADGVDWAICLDYDTLFMPTDLDLLLKTFAVRDDIHALAALQCKRYAETPLLTMIGGKSEPDNTYDVEVPADEPFRVFTAHFGLTIIDLNHLREVPKPWFWSQPDHNKSWRGDDHVDADIYFWRKWGEAGKTVYVHPGVRVGHLEVVTSMFNSDLSVERVPVHEFFTRRFQEVK